MIKLRKAEWTDIDLLFVWANDSTVRKYSFNSEPISYEVHKEWFGRMMNDPTVIQYILVDEDVPIGQIRLNTDGNEAEIGYSIASDYRGRGYGRKILQLVEDAVQSEYPEITKLIAKVKPDNIASKKIFEKEGYYMQYSCYSLEVTGGGHYGVSNNGGPKAVLNVDIYERRIAG